MTKLPSSLADWIKQGDQHAVKVQKRDRVSRRHLEAVIMHLRAGEVGKLKTDLATMRANFAELLYNLSEPIPTNETP